MTTTMLFLLCIAWGMQVGGWLLLVAALYCRAHYNEMDLIRDLQIYGGAASYPILRWIISILISGLWLGLYYFGDKLL